MRRSVRSAFVLGVLAGLVLALIRALSREARPGPAPLAAPAPTLPAVTPPARTPVPVETAAPPPVTAPVAPEPAPSTPQPATTPPPELESDAEAWVEPVDGDCPDGFPIKAKVASGIYHRPGGLSYARTKPDRCYPDEPAAEADGFRAAKR